MRSLSRKTSKVAGAAAIVALGLIGWVAKATLAQDPVKESAPAHVRDIQKPNAIAPQDVDVPKVKVGPSSTPDAVSLSEPSEKLGGSVISSPPTVVRPDALDGPSSVIAPYPRITIAQPAANDSEDPEKEAIVFVEQNQKQAESQLKNLRTEEAKLRARLQKVEAGIKRWESLVGALKQSQGNLAVVIPDNVAGWKQAVSLPPDSEPQNLAPVAEDLKPPPLPKR